MKKDIRVFASIVLMVLMGTSAVPSFSQERQAAPDRVIIERQRTESGPEVVIAQEHDRAMIERKIHVQGQGPSAGDYIFLATEMSFGGKLVKNAPYSAQAVTESVQTMTDGNRIINKSNAAVYRDSEGRTRREQSLKAIGPFASGGEPAVTIFINDPVAGTSYTLDPRTQTAHKMMPMRFKLAAAKTGTGEAKGSGQAKAGGSQELEVRQRESQGHVILERSSSPDERYKIAVEAANELKRSLESSAAMGVTSARHRAGKTESLAKQNIGGVDAEGTRTTVTIPAGEIGNERAIEIVSERWYSPELEVIVMTRHSDPRFGENTYQLTNISRSEPSRDLFEVPAGYTVKEPVTTSFGRGVGGGVGTGVGGGIMTTGGGGINGGVLNGKAVSLPMPEYPELARAAKASGSVSVQITIDEEGNVISAEPTSGHPLLRAAAVKAAREAKFSPTRLSGQPTRVNGIVVYNFVVQ